MSELDYEIVHLELDKVEALEIARNNFLGFVCYTKPDFQINWHHKIMADKLEQFAHGKIKRLILCLPPRNSKSELFSRRLPAYIFGHYPERRIIAASYADSLATSMNRDTQRIIDTHEYRTLFPNTEIAPFGSISQFARNNDLFEIVGVNKGSYRCCGVGGSITGFGADYILLDDVIKNADQAGSKTYRDKAWDWWQSTIYTRLEGVACAGVTLTRWHEDDIVGRLIEQAKNDPEADQWEIVEFPAIKEDDSNPDDPRQIGEALWPTRYDLKRLNRIKTTIGTRFWNALYQQRPSAMEGNIIKKTWWQFYDSVPLDLDHVWQSWDLTFDETEKGSYVVGTVWGKKRANFYLIDIFRERCTFTEQLKMIRKSVAQYPDTTRILVEKKANGAALINVLQSEIAGLIPVEPHGSKELRCEAIAPIIESGNVWLPKNKSWVQDFIDEHTNFPNGKNDDQVDSTSQYLFQAKSKLSLAEIL